MDIDILVYVTGAFFESFIFKLELNQMSSVTLDRENFVQWEDNLHKQYTHQEQIIILNWIARLRNEQNGGASFNQISLLEQDRAYDTSGKLENEAKEAWKKWGSAVENYYHTAPNEIILQEFYDSMPTAVQKKMRKKSRFKFS